MCLDYRTNKRKTLKKAEKDGKGNIYCYSIACKEVNKYYPLYQNTNIPYKNGWNVSRKVKHVPFGRDITSYVPHFHRSLYFAPKDYYCCFPKRVVLKWLVPIKSITCTGTQFNINIIVTKRCKLLGEVCID